MSRFRRQVIAQRRRIFVGCEGESEGGYAALLGRLLEEQHRRFHLDSVLLGGGDPLAIVETARRRLRDRANRGGPYAGRVIFLDSDRQAIAPERSIRAIALAGELDVHLIWQNPCHEALLLRHLPGCAQLQPQTSALAMDALLKHWPDYKKGMAAARLAQRLDRAAVLRAAAVEAALHTFLDTIEFNPPAEG